MSDEMVLTETNEVAVIQPQFNVIYWLPVFLDGIGEQFVRRDGIWVSVRTLPVIRFEKRREKVYMNTATGELVTA